MVELAEGVYFRGEGREAGEVGRGLKTGSARPSAPMPGAVCVGKVCRYVINQ